MLPKVYVDGFTFRMIGFLVSTLASLFQLCLQFVCLCGFAPFDSLNLFFFCSVGRWPV